MTIIRLDEQETASQDSKIPLNILNNTESLSKLAARLAHDLNVPLASILAYAEELVDLAQERYGVEGFKQLVEYIEIIQKEANHCQEIVEKMLAYAKGLEINLESVNVNTILKEILENFKHTIRGKAITIRTNFDPNLPNITTDPSGLRQVFINVLSNAGDAIDERGEICVQTCSHAKCIQIAITDTGAGIDETYLEKIFDPFFTTKDSGKGTGLGLAVCNGILQTLKGKIEVRSKKGRGTTISIRLPKKIKVILT
ncbi:MAG: sensor histidine kinase [bacterium]